MYLYINGTDVAFNSVGDFVSLGTVGEPAVPRLLIEECFVLGMTTKIDFAKFVLLGQEPLPLQQNVRKIVRR